MGVREKMGKGREGKRKKEAKMRSREEKKREESTPQTPSA